MSKIDFPSLAKALSLIAKEPYKSYLRIHLSTSLDDFIDSTSESYYKIWGKQAFQGQYIFTKGTGASAIFSLAFLLTHISHEFGSKLEHYLRKVKNEFPLSKWLSGSGQLAVAKGGGAGKKIVDTIFMEIIPDLNSGYPDPTVQNYLEKEKAKLLKKSVRLFLPSSWKPFVKDFVEKEKGSGVYLLIGLNKKMNKIQLRNGQADNLVQRLNSHLSNTKLEFDDDVSLIFYSTSNWKKKNLNVAEQAVFHLIPKKLRLKGVRHPGACRFCNLGMV